MSNIAHVITGTLSATIAIAVIAGWQHLHPSAPVVKVDIIGIVTAQQKTLAAQLKPGMDKAAQAAIIDQASRFGKRLDMALTQVSEECKCTIINSVAIIKDAPAGGTRDYTQRVTELIASAK